MDFYQNATGRCSNGMLIIDFIAVESGLPLLNPYKDENADFRHGVNFAVAGCTALSAKSLAGNNIVNIALTNSSLSVQLDWMSSHFQITCSPDCPEKMNKSLFLVGEIGGNEFIYGLSQGKTMDESRRMVPEVVQTIIHGVKRVIGFGATQIIVPGNFPIGCHPIFLTKFMTNISTAYDEYHCLKDLNNFAIFFNRNLQQAIDELKKDYPNITLIYGDYYNAFLWLLQNAGSLENAIVMNQPRPKVNNYTDATQLVIGPKRSNKIGRPSPSDNVNVLDMMRKLDENFSYRLCKLDNVQGTLSSYSQSVVADPVPLDVDSSDDDKGDHALSFDESTLVFDNIVASDSETVDDCIQTSLQECVVHDFPFGLNAGILWLSGGKLEISGISAYKVFAEIPFRDVDMKVANSLENDVVKPETKVFDERFHTIFTVRYDSSNLVMFDEMLFALSCMLSACSSSNGIIAHLNEIDPTKLPFSPY
uniref:Alpha-L-fucosidase 2 n=1 Tax=Solanum tuberosum TaxID=4113 RepID=M1B0G5_SOLTU